MGRKRLSADLFVFMNGEKVGRLTRTATGRFEFRYDQQWFESPLRRPLSLSLPLSPEPHSGDLVESFFDNLLPDNQAIRNRIQKQFGIPSSNCFDLLAQVGRDCVGALQLYPQDQTVEVQRIVAEPLTDQQIAQRLRSYRTMPLGMREDGDFRISIAGAQEKTALLWHRDSWHLPLGPTPTSHIFKLPIGKIAHSNMDLSDSVENEWLCRQILAAFGVPIAAAEMRTFDEVKVLVVERFDRRWSQDGTWLIRLPQEDMCQALQVPPALKYESDGGPGIQKVMDLLLGSVDGLQDRRRFMTAQVLFWLLAAIDGHAKNFSLFLLPEGAFRLTPLYDVMSAYPLVAKGQLDSKDLKMAMALRGKNRHYQWSHLQHRHWMSTAKLCNFPGTEMDKIIEDLLGQVDEVIQTVGATLPQNFPQEVAHSIFQGMKDARDRLTRSKN